MQVALVMSDFDYAAVPLAVAPPAVPLHVAPLAVAPPAVPLQVAPLAVSPPAVAPPAVPLQVTPPAAALPTVSPARWGMAFAAIFQPPAAVEQREVPPAVERSLPSVLDIAGSNNYVAPAPDVVSVLFMIW